MKTDRQRFREVARPWALAVVVALSLGSAGCARLGGPLSTTDGVFLDRQVVAAMGGRGALNDLRYLRWDVADRTHVWDRRAGRERVESHAGSDRDVALLHLKTGEGSAYRNNQPLPPSAQGAALDQARLWFARDKAWPLGPAIGLEPGARCDYAGEQNVNGRTYPTLHVAFDADAPGRPGESALDEYWFYIDPATRRPAAWAYELGGRAGTKETWLIESWQPVRGAMLPWQYRQVGGTATREVTIIAPGEVRDRVFNYPN